MITVTKQDGFIFFAVSVSVLAASMLVTQHRKTPYDAIFDAEGLKHNIDPDLLRAIAMKESSMHPDIVSVEPSRPGHKSYGLMQLFDDTAKRLGITNLQSLLVPEINIAEGAKLLASDRTSLGDKFSLDAWIASYNAGVTAILKQGIFNQSYVAAVKQHLYLYKIGRSLG